MRQSQQGKRMRGRGGRKGGGNPGNRTYESNGPDVKVRGTAAHVAEKYVQLARDAASSGDYITSENYLQHAEHYFRIVAAAQPPEQRQAAAAQADTSQGDTQNDAGDTALVNGHSRNHERAAAEQPSELDLGDKGNAAETIQDATDVAADSSGGVEDGNAAPAKAPAKRGRGRPRRSNIRPADDRSQESANQESANPEAANEEAANTTADNGDVAVAASASAADIATVEA